jgi:hypothetical protein
MGGNNQSKLADCITEDFYLLSQLATTAADDTSTDDSTTSTARMGNEASKEDTHNQQQSLTRKDSLPHDTSGAEPSIEITASDVAEQQQEQQLWKETEIPKEPLVEKSDDALDALLPQPIELALADLLFESPLSQAHASTRSIMTVEDEPLPATRQPLGDEQASAPVSTRGSSQSVSTVQDESQPEASLQDDSQEQQLNPLISQSHSVDSGEIPDLVLDAFQPESASNNMQQELQQQQLNPLISRSLSMDSGEIPILVPDSFQPESIVNDSQQQQVITPPVIARSRSVDSGEIPMESNSNLRFSIMSAVATAQGNTSAANGGDMDTSLTHSESTERKPQQLYEVDRIQDAKDCFSEVDKPFGHSIDHFDTPTRNATTFLANSQPRVEPNVADSITPTITSLYYQQSPQCQESNDLPVDNKRLIYHELTKRLSKRYSANERSIEACGLVPDSPTEQIVDEVIFKHSRTPPQAMNATINSYHTADYHKTTCQKQETPTTSTTGSSGDESSPDLSHRLSVVSKKSQSIWQEEKKDEELGAAVVHHTSVHLGDIDITHTESIDSLCRMEPATPARSIRVHSDALIGDASMQGSPTLSMMDDTTPIATNSTTTRPFDTVQALEQSSGRDHNDEDISLDGSHSTGGFESCKESLSPMATPERISVHRRAIDATYSLDDEQSTNMEASTVTRKIDNTEQSARHISATNEALKESQQNSHETDAAHGEGIDTATILDGPNPALNDSSDAREQKMEFHVGVGTTISHNSASLCLEYESQHVQDFTVGENATNVKQLALPATEKLVATPRANAASLREQDTETQLPIEANTTQTAEIPIIDIVQNKSTSIMPPALNLNDGSTPQSLSLHKVFEATSTITDPLTSQENESIDSTVKPKRELRSADTLPNSKVVTHVAGDNLKERSLHETCHIETTFQTLYKGVQAPKSPESVARVTSENAEQLLSTLPVVESLSPLTLQDTSAIQRCGDTLPGNQTLSDSTTPALAPVAETLSERSGPTQHPNQQQYPSELPEKRPFLAQRESNKCSLTNVETRSPEATLYTPLAKSGHKNTTSTGDETPLDCQSTGEQSNDSAFALDQSASRGVPSSIETYSSVREVSLKPHQSMSQSFATSPHLLTINGFADSCDEDSVATNHCEAHSRHGLPPSHPIANRTLSPNTVSAKTPTIPRGSRSRRASVQAAPDVSKLFQLKALSPFNSPMPSRATSPAPLEMKKSFTPITITKAPTTTNEVASLFRTSSGKGTQSKELTKLIRSDLWNPNPSIVEKALRQLHYAAIDSSKVALIARTGGLLAVVNAMENHVNHAGVQIAACNALEKLALDCENELAIGEVGGIEAILGAMLAHFNDPRVQEAAWSALWNLTCGNADCSSISEAGIEAIVSCMMRHVEHAQVQRNACGTLSNLCQDNDDRLADFARAGGFVAVSMALQKHWNDRDVRQEASHALVVLLGPSAETYEVPTNHSPLGSRNDD